MDQFNVPKKVNRNVIKALCILHKSQRNFIDSEVITEQVKQQLLRSKPVENVEHVIAESLCNLTNLGILARTGSSMYMLLPMLRDPCGSAVSRALPRPNINVPFCPNPPARPNAQKQVRPQSGRRLDPWKPVTRVVSEDSLSGDERTKARKRIRTNTKRVIKNKKEVLIPQAGPRIPNRNSRPKTGVRKKNMKAKPQRNHSLRHVVCQECLPVALGCDDLFSTTSLTANEDIISQDVVMEEEIQTESSPSSEEPSWVASYAQIHLPQVEFSNTSIHITPSPQGLNVRPSGGTPGRELDAPNASTIGLCGSSFNLASPADSQNFIHDWWQTHMSPEQGHILGARQTPVQSQVFQEAQVPMQASLVEETQTPTCSKQSSYTGPSLITPKFVIWESTSSDALLLQQPTTGATASGESEPPKSQPRIPVEPNSSQQSSQSSKKPKDPPRDPPNTDEKPLESQSNYDFYK